VFADVLDLCDAVTAEGTEGGTMPSRRRLLYVFVFPVVSVALYQGAYWLSGNEVEWGFPLVWALGWVSGGIVLTLLAWMRR
jgi:hypothetical protein